MRPLPASRPSLFLRSILCPYINPSTRLYSVLTQQESSSLQRSVTIQEFEQEVENELAKLPLKQAEEARRQLRNERRAERSGVRNPDPLHHSLSFFRKGFQTSMKGE